MFASSSGWGVSNAPGGIRWGAKGEGTGPVVPLPREGVMYDVVDEVDASVICSME